MRVPQSRTDPVCLPLFLGPPGASPGPGSRWQHHSPGGYGLCPALAPALGAAERQRGGCVPSKGRPPGQTPRWAFQRGQPLGEAGTAFPGPPEHQEARQLDEQGRGRSGRRERLREYPEAPRQEAHAPGCALGSQPQAPRGRGARSPRTLSASSSRRHRCEGASPKSTRGRAGGPRG